MSKSQQSKKGQQEPPQPPETERKIQFHLTQLIGMPFIILIPLLALGGLFGQVRGEQQAGGAQIELQVQYPERDRYFMPTLLEINVKNISSQEIPTVTVSLDNSYIEQFNEVQFTPNVDEIDDKAHKVELTEVGAGETRKVTVELRGDIYGSQNGEVVAEPEGGEAVRVPIGTFIFP